MKKPTVVLASLLYVGVAQIGLSQIGVAQSAQSSYSQALVVAKQNFKAKNYAAAEQDGQKLLALATSPDQIGVVLAIRGESLYRRQMYDQAREQWNKALTLPVNKDESILPFVAHIGLARSYSAQGSFDKAIPEYKAVLEYKAVVGEKSKNNFFPFSLALANAYYHTQQLDLAQEQLSQVIASSQDPDADDILMIALTRDGEIDFRQNRFKKSLAEFQQVIDIKGVTPEIKGRAQMFVTASKYLIEHYSGKELKVNYKPDKELDNKFDIAIQEGLDDFVGDENTIEALES